MRLVIISGTPGTGKTSVSNKISEMIDVNVITLNELAISEGLIHDFDKMRETNIVDIDKLVSHVLKMVEEFKKKRIKFSIRLKWLSAFYRNPLGFPLLPEIQHTF